jgi:hypothetical protein
MKTIFKNTARVKKAGIPQGKPAEYKNSKTVITGEPVKRGSYKPVKPVKPAPPSVPSMTSQPRRDSSLAAKAKDIQRKAAYNVKQAAHSVSKGTRPTIEKFKGVFQLDKKMNRGGKVTK